MAMDFSWLPQEQDVSRLPLGMRVNNPGNIKYFRGLNYPGMLGPSQHTDQGDPQMTFDTPQSGMNAASSLALRKYKGGMRTPMDIVSGKKGWTPGNVVAAQNIARSMGISPNDDLGLDDPKRLATFLRALTRQEHGGASGLYGDDLYANAASTAVGATPAQHQAAALRERFAPQTMGTTTEGGVTAPAPTQEVGSPTDRLKAALAKYDQSWIDTGKGLQKRGQEIASSYGNRLGAYGGAGIAALGGFLEGMEDAEKKKHDEEFSQRASEASNTEGLMNVMLSSSDPKMREAGIELKAKLLAPQQPVEINGRLVQKQSDGSYKEVYAAPPKQQGPMEVGGRIVQQQPDGSFKEVYAAPPKPSAPVVTEVYDAEGRKQKAVVQPDTGEFKPIGGAAAADAAAKLGLHPQTYVDKDGNLVYTQLSEAGGRKDVELPEGARWAPGYDIKDTGTALTGINKRTGEVGPVVPKDVAGKERLEEIGKGQGQAQVDLPRVESNTESMLAQIDATRSDPYLPSMTGPFDTWRPNLSGDAARVQSKVDQLGGQAFLQAFQSLKGGGQITELEGAKATAALARLQNMGVNDADYLKALDDFKGEVIRLRDLARQRAGGGSSSAPPPSSPSGGNTRLRFNPATGELE